MVVTEQVVEGEDDRGILGRALDLLRENGLYSEFVVRACDIDSFLRIYDLKASRMGFHNHRRSKTTDNAHSTDILGSRLKTTLVGMLPGGDLTKYGMRLGAEVNIVRHDDDLAVNLLVIPYNNLLDDREDFLLSQGMIERLTDNSYCRETFARLQRRIVRSDLHVDLGIPDGMKEKVRQSLFTYSHAANAYSLNQDVACSHCGYVFGAFMWVDSQEQDTTETRCPKCNENFEVEIQRTSDRK